MHRDRSRRLYGLGCVSPRRDVQSRDRCVLEPREGERDLVQRRKPLHHVGCLPVGLVRGHERRLHGVGRLPSRGHMQPRHRSVLGSRGSGRHDVRRRGRVHDRRPVPVGRLWGGHPPELLRADPDRDLRKPVRSHGASGRGRADPGELLLRARSGGRRGHPVLRDSGRRRCRAAVLHRELEPRGYERRMGPPAARSGVGDQGPRDAVRRDGARGVGVGLRCDVSFRVHRRPGWIGRRRDRRDRGVHRSVRELRRGERRRPPRGRGARERGTTVCTRSSL